MAKVTIDLMGEEWKESQIEFFTIPSRGVCISIKTDKTEVEIDLPEAVYNRVMAGLTKMEIT